jgi:hypothetical protein
MTLPNGIPYYTPGLVIKDEASGAVISDSMKITEYYLDAQYPEKLLIIPGASSLYKALDTAILVLDLLVARCSSITSARSTPS